MCNFKHEGTIFYTSQNERETGEKALIITRAPLKLESQSLAMNLKLSLNSSHLKEPTALLREKY